MKKEPCVAVKEGSRTGFFSNIKFNSLLLPQEKINI